MENNSLLTSSLWGIALYKGYRFLFDTNSFDIIYSGSNIFTTNTNYNYHDMVIIKDTLYVAAYKNDYSENIIIFDAEGRANKVY